MEYIILAAGIGTRLYPYTKNSPKCLVKVSESETVIERAVRLIHTNDKKAHITIVLGFCADQIKGLLGKKCDYIFNPYYRVTNSVASLWFAKDILLSRRPVTILNADIVFCEKLAKEITRVSNDDVIYYDSSIRMNGDYNVQVLNNQMIVMGKELDEYSGEYVGVTKFTPEGARFLAHEVDNMVKDELYDQWYENALVQMSLTMQYKFNTFDVQEYAWSEIDSIDNLLKIRKIIQQEKK